jgi:hypothetical protein
MFGKKLNKHYEVELYEAARTARLLLSVWSSFLAEGIDYPEVFEKVRMVAAANDWSDKAHLYSHCDDDECVMLTQKGLDELPYVQSELGRALGYMEAMLWTVRTCKAREEKEQNEVVD